MTANQIILLCMIPLAAGLLTVPMVNSLHLSRLVGVVALGLNALLGLTLLLQVSDGSVMVTNLGGWPSPFAINMIFDSFSGLLIVASSLVALATYIHSFSTLQPRIERRYYHPLFMLLMFGVNMCFLTGDLFNLFVAFEIALMASYALLCIGGSRKQMSQAYKYVVLNLLASTVFVMAAGMTYGMFGTLNIAHIADIVRTLQAAGEPLPTGFTALGAVLLMVFAVKGAFFPMWFWLPDTYYTCPISVAALFSGLLTKVGVYCVARIFPLIFFAGGAGDDWLVPLLAVSACATMFLAVLGAVSQSQVRRILSIHVISQVGYMIFAIVVMTGYALAGAVLFIVHNMIVKSCLFLCCGIMEKHAGTDNLNRLGGLLKRDVYLAVLFFIAAMSLVGLPPLSGFFGKLIIVHAGWEEWWWVAVFALITSPLTLLSMLKIWSYGFWNPAQDPIANHPAPKRGELRAGYIGTTMLVVVALFLGFGAEPVYQVARNAGDQLENPSAYINAVMGDRAITVIEAPLEDASDKREALTLKPETENQKPETSQ
ncbi:proton-conducting transporter membrane subunit [Phycisphaerales bacterium AB-hyl4]|uniref:Proton-conducting transporter membrane subunit n=1 Tax=Natronomicrosphaera hydrolytica TaxID=3242702 RepID=A0ABV4U988_9BACT